MDQYLDNLPSEKDALKFSLYGKEEPKNELHWTFFPLPFKKYLLFVNEGHYSYWNDVVEICGPYLARLGIHLGEIVMDENLKKIKFSNRISTKNLRHISYLSQKAVGTITDALWLDGINSSNVLVIKEQKIEEIAQKVLDFCGVDIQIGVKTFFEGDSYNMDLVEIIPDFAFTPHNSLPRDTTIGIRCDLFPNWKFALDAVQSGLKPVIKIGGTKIPKSMLPFLKDCKKIVCMIDKGVTPEHVREIEKLGINYTLYAEESEKNEQQKFDFFDFKPIKIEKSWAKKNLDKLEALPQNTRIKTRRLLVSKDGTFASLFHWKRGIRINEKGGTFILNGVDDKDFLEEADLFLYYVSN